MAVPTKSKPFDWPRPKKSGKKRVGKTKGWVTFWQPFWWFDGELRQEIRCKNILYKIIKAQESTDKSIWTDFKKGKIAVPKLLVCERREYIISTLDENKNDLKKFWKEPNSNINIGKSKTSTNSTSWWKDSIWIGCGCGHE